ncbi:ESPR domain-containing protein [Gallibacterium salpingitidis]|uniref:ESPR domain-containing protein n=1 Tax=Gallibacterium salpingitidis TaxID=505341 RepID=UPI00267004BB|nr:ESPR domain-containing protein [Gallibacterium salpingitidis]WKS98936.1 ESPR domain-containing protein [Gallibacterium salpingitidis]
MNHIFRVIFDKTRGIFVAVSELTKSHGKEKSEKQQSRDVVTNMLGGGEFDSSLTSKNPTYFSSQNKKVKFFALSPLAVVSFIAAGVLTPWTDAWGRMVGLLHNAGLESVPRKVTGVIVLVRVVSIWRFSTKALLQTMMRIRIIPFVKKTIKEIFTEILSLLVLMQK